MPHLRIAFAMIVLASPLTGQDSAASPVPVGSNLRILTRYAVRMSAAGAEPRPVVGRLDAFVGDTVVLTKYGPRQTLRIPRDEIVSVHVARGRNRPIMRAVAIGFVTGALLGAALLALGPDGGGGESVIPEETGPAARVGGTIGGVAGALVGLSVGLVGHTRWIAIDASALR